MKTKKEFISGLEKKILADPEMTKKVRFLQEVIIKNRLKKPIKKRELRSKKDLGLTM